MQKRSRPLIAGLQGTLVLLAAAHLLVPATAYAAKKHRVVVMQTQSEGLADADKAAATTVVRDALSKYPDVTLLPTPTMDFLELMLELECTDTDATCLGSMAKYLKADRIVYSEAEPKGQAVTLKFQVISAAGKVIKKQTVTASSKSMLPKKLGMLVADAFGAPPVVAPKLGRITIRANVEGAAVTINGRAVGVTPKKLPLKPGRYKIEVRADGYMPMTQTVTVAAGKNPVLNMTLDKVPVTTAVKDPIKDPTVTPDEPKEDPEIKSDSPAFYKTWWFWTIVGVGVAGGVTAAVIATQGDSPQPTGVLNFGFGAPDYDPAVIREANP